MKARLPLRQGFLARLAGVRELGRRFLGWEISDVYHALACARVLQASEPSQSPLALSAG